MLNRAVIEGNTEEVKKLLREHHSPNQYEKGDTPLLAVVINHICFHQPSLPVCMEIIDLLIDGGANINAKDTQGQIRTVLHWAAEAKSPDLVGFLLKRGASVHSTNYFNDTPLHLAISTRSVSAPHELIFETAKLLLEAGANINASSRLGFSPYSYARGDSALETLLKSYGIPGERSDTELWMSQIEQDFSTLFKRTTPLVEVKPLTELAAKTVIENKSLLFSKLKGVPDDLKSKFPELELIPIKRFTYKVEKLIERFLEKFTQETDEQELSFLAKMQQALSEKNPYNSINILLRKLDSIMKKSFLSTFTDNMKPLRNQMVTILKEYNSDKTFYVDQNQSLKLDI